MKYLLAVSGGVDSVVMLDMLARREAQSLTVAHFDHGIRTDSAADARFVKALAARYNVPFVSKREELGPRASEDYARKQRYIFLRDEAQKIGATIMTAHHADDVIETIAINIKRGTGWRGVAALDAVDITRPLLDMRKKEIRAYALRKRLEWVEDSTNASTMYLRNRVRQRLASNLSPRHKKRLLDLWKEQRILKSAIETEVAQYMHFDTPYDRYFFITIEPAMAIEILRTIITTISQKSPTRPQTERALLAIKTARAGTTFELGDGIKLYFTTDKFVVQTP